MDVKKLFVYRLYVHSRLAFIVFVCFLAGYSFFFFKKMDMTIFAYNSMFVIAMDRKQTHAYALKINGQVVQTSHHLWWKKDFLESSLIGYSAYLEKEHKTYLQQFLISKIPDPQWRDFFVHHLTAKLVEPMDFLNNYARVAGQPLQAGDKVEIIKYHLQFLRSSVIKQDSTIIFIKRSH
jgi:hypothetical protein